MKNRLHLLLIPFLFFLACTDSTNISSDLLKLTASTNYKEVEKESLDTVIVKVESTVDVLDSAITVTLTDKNGNSVSGSNLSALTLPINTITNEIKTVLTIGANCLEGSYILNYTIIVDSLEDTFTVELVVKGENDLLILSTTAFSKSIFVGAIDSLPLTVTAPGKVTQDSLIFEVKDSTGTILTDSCIVATLNTFSSLDTTVNVIFNVSNSCAEGEYTIHAIGQYGQLLDTAIYQIAVISDMAIGQWELSIPAGLLSDDQPATDVLLTVGETTFSLVVTQMLIGTIKTTVYSSTGTADISSNPVVFTGEECLILDPTSGQLVSLELVSPGACATPVSVSTDGLESTKWVIAGSQLVPAMPFLTTDQKTAIGLASLTFNKK